MTDLPDRHGAEDVEENKTAVSHVITQQVPVAQTLNSEHAVEYDSQKKKEFHYNRCFRKQSLAFQDILEK
jgi:hypothetical protein